MKIMFTHFLPPPPCLNLSLMMSKLKYSSPPVPCPPSPRSDLDLDEEAPPLPPRMYGWSDVEDNDDELFQSDDDLDDDPVSGEEGGGGRRGGTLRMTTDEHQALYNSVSPILSHSYCIILSFVSLSLYMYTCFCLLYTTLSPFLIPHVVNTHTHTLCIRSHTLSHHWRGVQH